MKSPISYSGVIREEKTGLWGNPELERGDGSIKIWKGMGNEV